MYNESYITNLVIKEYTEELALIHKLVDALCASAHPIIAKYQMP